MAKAKGKYASVLGRLPALGIDPSRRDAVTQAQEQIKAPPGEDFKINADDQKQTLSDASELMRYLVELKKRQTAGKPYAAEYARAYAECRAIRDTIAEWDGAFSLLVEAYQWLMIEQLEVEGTRSLKLSNGASITTFEEPQAKVDDPEAYRVWCMAPADVCMTCGEREAAPWHDDLSSDPAVHTYKPGGGMTNKMQLPWGTTNALTKEMLLAGAPEPDGVTVWKKTVVRLGAGDE